MSFLRPLLKQAQVKPVQIMSVKEPTWCYDDNEGLVTRNYSGHDYMTDEGAEFHMSLSVDGPKVTIEIEDSYYPGCNIGCPYKTHKTHIFLSWEEALAFLQTEWLSKEWKTCGPRCSEPNDEWYETDEICEPTWEECSGKYCKKYCVKDIIRKLAERYKEKTQ